MNERGLTNDSTVKMNPFTISEAEHGRSCRLFTGERGVSDVRKNPIGVYCSVNGSNRWRRDHLLVKGVDYT